MNRALCVKLAFYMFIAVLSAGMFLEFGLGWALITAGICGGASVLTLHDVDEEEGGK